jgi:hypothetical protein
MKRYKFNVCFTGASMVEVYAGGFFDAVILACAERIKEGKHIKIFMVGNRDTNEFFEMNGERPALKVQE